MSVEFLLAGVVVSSLVIYALSGGADFGGGAWSLFAYGERKQQQQNLIERAIAPIWETNHVWVILVIVVLFVAYPLAFSSIATSLHIPLTIMLIGIVLRGCAFIFRAYGMKEDKKLHNFWEKVFGISSLLTPITFGVIVAAVANGKLRVDVENSKVMTDFFEAWSGVFPFSVGLFTLFTFMFLAAVYLSCEAENTELQNDFRLRAIFSAVLLDITAMWCLYLSREHATLFWEGLWSSKYAIFFHGCGIVLATSIFFTLYRCKYKMARILAMTKVVCIVLGWAVCQFPFLVVPDLTIYTATAPKNVMYMMTTIIFLGMVVTVPSLYYLFYVFKKKQEKNAVIRDILKTTDQKKCCELFAQLPQKYSYHAVMLLLWQHIETQVPTKETLEKILELTHIKPGDENKYISYSILVESWPQEFLALDFALSMDMLSRENPLHKGIERAIHAALRLKNEKLAVTLSEKLPDDKNKSDVLARVAISASKHKGHRQSTWFLEQAIAAYKHKPSSTGLSSIISAWENTRLRNRKRVFITILGLCEKSLSQKQELLLLAETIVCSKQIDKSIYAALILEKILKHNQMFLVDKLIDYVTQYKMLTRIFQRSKQLPHDDKHQIMCKYFFQLATLEENKKKSSQLMSKSFEHLRSVNDRSIELQLRMNIIRRLIGIKKANKAYNMIFDVMDCYRKLWRSTNYEHQQKILLSIDFAAFLARIKEYERAGGIFNEVLSNIKDLQNEKDRVHMLRTTFEKLLRYTHIKNRLSLLHETLDILEAINSDHDKGFALNSLGFESGGMISDLGNYPNERSEELLLRVIEIAKPLDDHDFFIDVLAAMAKCRLKESAYQTYQQFLRGKSLSAQEVERIAQQLIKVKKKSMAAKLIKSYLLRQEQLDLGA